MGQHFALQPWLWPRSVLHVRKSLKEWDEEWWQEQGKGVPLPDICPGGSQREHTVHILWTLNILCHFHFRACVKQLVPASSSSSTIFNMEKKYQNSTWGCCTSPGSATKCPSNKKWSSGICIQSCQADCSNAHSHLLIQSSAGFNLFAQKYLSAIFKSHTRFHQLKKL